MPKDLPEMFVEKRESSTAHGIAAPDLSRENMKIQCEETLQLNDDGKGCNGAWPDTTIAILDKYVPGGTTAAEVAESVMEVCGFRNWKTVCQFVVDDMCSEFFNIALKYCLQSGQSHHEELGFIDGSGIGYLETYRDRLKVTLEQCFDAKWFFQVPRPLEYLLNESGVDMSDTANAIHPGHHSFPAGHGTKFLTAVEVLGDVFALTDECRRKLLVVACVLSQGRSGNLIHYPMDNLAGGSLTTLPEFS